MSLNSSERKKILGKLLAKQEGKCYWCRCELSTDGRTTTKHPDNTATFDHIMPKCDGGKDKTANLVLACYKCNQSRKNKMSCPQNIQQHKTLRPTNLALESLINLYFPVHDYGFIALKDYMGTQECVEEAARVSYSNGTRKVNETEGLLRYLMRKEHGTPYEMCELKFHIGMPIFVARQWVRFVLV